MKATLVGFKKFTGKDGRKWVDLGLMYKDMQAQGGAFASSVILSDEKNVSASLISGEMYDVDFDKNGHLLGFERITK